MKVKKIKNEKVPGAWIVNPTDRGRIAIRSGKCFLQNRFCFDIELFNPLTECVLADIKLNGQSISKTGLVIKPGQRFYLDCFVDDKKKFVFNTYEVETNLESIEATKNNGLLEVFFYKEDVITINNWRSRFDRVIVERWYPNYYPGYNPWWEPNRIYFNSGTGTIGNCGGIGSTTTSNAYYGTSNTNGVVGTNAVVSNTGSIDLTSLNAVYDSGYSNNMMLCSSVNNEVSMNHETGRVEKGSSSSQKFTEVDMDFEKNYISSTIIEILPESVKPLDVKKIKKTVVNIELPEGVSKEEAIEVVQNYIWKEDTPDMRKDMYNTIDLIKKLSELHTAGILTDEEFSNKKSELLSKI
jgi:hypothetical protein